MDNNRKDINKILETVRLSNKGRRINIRFRKGVNGYTVFLDYFHNDKHQYYFFKQKFIGRTDTKIQDDDFLRVVMKTRDDQDFLLFENEENFRLPNKAKFADFIAYYEEIAEMQKRPQYQGSLKHLKEYINDRHLRFLDLTPKFFEGFVEYLLLKMSVNTVIGYLNVIRATLNKAIKEKYISENPLNEIRLKEVETEKVFLTEEELKRFNNLKTQFVETQNAFLFACFTGLRLSDVSSLRFDQVQDGVLRFRQKKTNKPEYFPLSDDAIRIIQLQKEHYPESDKLFNQISKSALNRQLKLIAKEAGINKDLHFHSSRHTFAIRCLNNGMSIYEVSKFLGHTDIKTTEIYLQFIDEHKRSAIQKLPKLT